MMNLLHLVWVILVLLAFAEARPQESEKVKVYCTRGKENHDSQWLYDEAHKNVIEATGHSVAFNCTYGRVNPFKISGERYEELVKKCHVAYGKEFIPQPAPDSNDHRRPFFSDVNVAARAVKACYKPRDCSKTTLPGGQLDGICRYCSSHPQPENKFRAYATDCRILKWDIHCFNQWGIDYRFQQVPNHNKDPAGYKRMMDINAKLDADFYKFVEDPKKIGFVLNAYWGSDGYKAEMTVQKC